VLTYLFAWVSGWWRETHLKQVGSVRLIVPSRWMVVSGICTALVLFTVPLSFTFKGVSIPFIQLLMRGDLLLIAPLVDLVNGRKVRWYSWVALGLVAVGVTATLHQRGGLKLSGLAIATVVLYTVGYFGRLMAMTKLSKDGDVGRVKGYFVEEKLIAYPVALVLLALIPLLGLGTQGSELRWGFVAVWRSAQLGQLSLLAVMLFVISIFSALILLDRRENSFCVPMERSASIVAGIAASFLLAVYFKLPMPTNTEFVGAGLMVIAVVLLSVGPHLRRGGETDYGVRRDAKLPL